MLYSSAGRILQALQFRRENFTSFTVPQGEFNFRCKIMASPEQNVTMFQYLDLDDDRRQRPLLRGPSHSLRLGSFLTGPCVAKARAKAALYVYGNRPHDQPFLLITGGTGSGRTHLLHAVAHLAVGNHMIDHVSVFSAARLLHEILESRQLGDWDQWRQRIEEDDFLAIDDVHVLAGNIKIAEDVLAILQQRGKHLSRTVLTSCLVEQLPDTELGQYLARLPALSLHQGIRHGCACA
jgi:chromosomal replication initiation ATPase DnaA